MKTLPLSPSSKVSLVFAGLAILFVVAAVGIGVYSFSTKEFSTNSVFFRSWESTTIQGEPVYNTIKYFKKPNKEIWMMNQSHHGFKATSDQLDRLAIVISANKADFFQLTPGPLEWSEDLPRQKIDLKVDCKQCHSNGPRAIRPASDYVSLFTVKEKSILFLLNLRIKFYGKMKNELWMHDETLQDKKSFSFLNSQTCLQCHNDGNAPWNRSRLTLQQRDTIRFLVENQQMPPRGISFSEEEKAELKRTLGVISL